MAPSPTQTSPKRSKRSRSSGSSERTRTASAWTSTAPPKGTGRVSPRNPSPRAARCESTPWTSSLPGLLPSAPFWTTSRPSSSPRTWRTSSRVPTWWGTSGSRTLRSTCSLGDKETQPCLESTASTCSWTEDFQGRRAFGTL